jgi:hypothetical protein
VEVVPQHVNYLKHVQAPEYVSMASISRWLACAVRPVADQLDLQAKRAVDQVTELIDQLSTAFLQVSLTLFRLRAVLMHLRA